MAFVGNNLITFAETFEKGHGKPPAVSPIVTKIVGVGGGVAFGILLGVVVFGFVYYLFEPAIPGAADTKSYVLAAAGFLTVSGAPWVLLPPQPPGISQTLPTETRLLWYGIMMVAGAVASGTVMYAYRQLRRELPKSVAAAAALTALALIPVVAFFAPANSVSGPIPETLADVFRAVTAAGQVGLWITMASTHAWLNRRSDDAEKNTEVTEDTISSTTTLLNSD
jgi:predicted cobalt transporter CbtA